MTLKNEKRNMIFAGLVIGVIASLLVLFGNPKNMGFCVACFLRDTAGGLGLHLERIVAVVQAALIAAFALLNHFSDDPGLQSLIVRVNPISCLVLGWHSSKSSELSAILASPYGGIYPAFSIVYVLILCVIATVVGGVLVSRHDLLASNTETGGN